jgi:hypothetical protein
VRSAGPIDLLSTFTHRELHEWLFRRDRRRMPRIFNSIRQRMLVENRLTRYLVYAVGEIFLVVVGILIALQLNTNKDLRKARETELNYLQNIKADLVANRMKADEFITARSACLGAAQRIIAKIDGETITDWKAFNSDLISIYGWKRYYPINYTMEELLNSGGFAQITNDSIKTSLLMLESLYKQAKAEEDHFRFDSEEIIYKPVYALMDLGPTLDMYMGKEVELRQKDFDPYFADVRVKNGFLMVLVEFSTMNAQLQEIGEMSERLVAMVDREIARE